MLVEKLTYETDAIANLLQQFRDQSNIEGFVRTFSASAQELESTLHDVDTELRLTTATGQQLDELGEVVKLDRGDLDDIDYSARLRARIRANRSEGTPNDVLETLRLMVVTNDLEYSESYPAACLIQIYDALAMAISVVAVEAGRTRPTGVNLQLIYSLYSNETTFTFSSGDTEEASTAQGWADDTPVTYGGYMADAELT